MFCNIQGGRKFTSRSGTRIRSVAMSCMVTDTATSRRRPAHMTLSVQHGDLSAHCESRFHKCFSVVGHSWGILIWYTAELIATICVHRPWAKSIWNWESLCGILTNMASSVKTMQVFDEFCHICNHFSLTFLRTKAGTAIACLSHRYSVRPSICLSHGWLSQKRCKLRSPNFHRRLPGRL